MLLVDPFTPIAITSQVAQLTAVTEYMVILEGNSRPQNQAIAQNIEDKMAEMFDREPRCQVRGSLSCTQQYYESKDTLVEQPRNATFLRRITPTTNSMMESDEFSLWKPEPARADDYRCRVIYGLSVMDGCRQASRSVPRGNWRIERGGCI